jgi:hypothetical protein
VHSVRELKVQVNGLNGTLGSPGIIHNLLQLHACGMTKLNLQGNDLSGSMTPEWGRMTNLVVLDLCEYAAAAAAIVAGACGGQVTAAVAGEQRALALPADCRIVHSMNVV